MKRIQTLTAVANFFGIGKNGFTDGDPTSGIEATDCEARFFNQVQESIVRVEEAAGLTPDDDYDQFLNALLILINSRVLPFPTGYYNLGGWQMSRNVGAPNTKLDITAGKARSRDDTANIVGGAMTKDISAVWAAGNGNGMLDTGTVAAGGSVHCYAIRKTSDGSVDYIGSLAGPSTGPALPAGYGSYRYIGSWGINISSQLRAAKMIGRHHYYDTPVQSTNVSNLGSSTTLFPTSTPHVLGLNVILNCVAYAASVGGVIIEAGFATGTNPSTGGTSLNWEIAGGGQSGRITVPIDENTNIRATSNVANTTFQVWTVGWEDTAIGRL